MYTKKRVASFRQKYQSFSAQAQYHSHKLGFCIPGMRLLGLFPCSICKFFTCIHVYKISKFLLNIIHTSLLIRIIKKNPFVPHRTFCSQLTESRRQPTPVRHTVPETVDTPDEVAICRGVDPAGRSRARHVARSPPGPQESHPSPAPDGPE